MLRGIGMIKKILFALFFGMIVSLYSVSMAAAAPQKTNASKPVIIQSIPQMDVAVKQNDKYTLPKVIKATMSDGSSKNVIVQWNKGVTTS